MHSAEVEHVVLHALAAHVYGAHWIVALPTHLPVPSQVPAEVAVDAPAQPAPHALPLTNAQALRVRPLQVVAAQSPGPEPALQLPWPATGLPSTGVQTPSEPPTLHASQVPPHAVLQQTPSTHRPDAHCVPAPQGWPRLSVQVPGLLPLQVPLGQEALPQQTPSVHESPDEHCDALAHGLPSPILGAHAPPLHQ